MSDASPAARCFVDRALERVGDDWTLRILRDAFLGLTRFDALQTHLGIAPNMLSRRLNDLVAAGLMERRLYCAKPPRNEYLLTAAGRDFWPVLVLLADWGERHCPEGAPGRRIIDAATGLPAEPILMDQVSGQPIDPEHFRFASREPTASMPALKEPA